LYQNIELRKFNEELKINPISHLTFRKEDKALVLSKSESFFLFTELQKSSYITTCQKLYYKIENWNNNKEVYEYIETDGRYFKYNDKILDLGYNFIIHNNLSKKIGQRKDYE